MDLNERKLKILQAIVQDYIDCAEPVGSRTLSKKYNLGVSPATIRNEMADLEELGFLMQPHTSAGRIPSDKAYRLYVDYLMQVKKIAAIQRSQLKEKLVRSFSEIEQLLQYSSRVLSELTQYTTVAIAPQIKGSKLKQIQLIPIDSEHIISVIITDTGVVKKPLLRIPGGIGDISVLMRVSGILNEKLRGKTLQDVEELLEKELKHEVFRFSSVMETIIPELFKTLEEIDDFELYLNGTTNIFNFPEFSDLIKAKSFLTMLEEKKKISELIISSGEGISISIGAENFFEQARDCSLVTATFKVDNSAIGWLSVIGPTRMDYSKVIGIMGQISSYINELLKTR